MAAMTAKQRRDLVDKLTGDAAERGLRLQRRGQTKSKWVWDIHDEARGNLAVRGVTLHQAAGYLRTQPASNDVRAA